MAELNEKDLLLLNSLIYVNTDYSPGRTVADIVNELSQPGALDHINEGGGMSKADVEEMLKEVAQNEALMDLTIDSSVDTDIRGVCFVDSQDNAVIAFRGTGPAYAAWDDNCQGGYLSDTDMQKEALAFAQDCASRYDDITVSGHSKGGNMAQYVTVLMGDEVDRCVSFDGQGFGEDFLEKYADEIAANQSKIRSVCSYNDYVNILLTSIAGETVYLDNNESTFPGGHFVYELYRNQNNKLDKNGEYKQAREQDAFIAKADQALDVVVEKLAELGLEQPLVEFLVYSFVGMLMGGALGEDTSIIGIIMEFLANLEDFVEDYNEKQRVERNKDKPVDIRINTDAMRSAAARYRRAAVCLESLRQEISALRKKMATNIVNGVAVGIPLQIVIARLDDEYADLKKLVNFLENAAQRYDDAERMVKGKAQ